MKYAIIAAGEGSRLAAENITAAKPLVKVHGEALIDRLIRIFMQNHAEEITVVCNEQAGSVVQHLDDIRRKGIGGVSVPLRFLKRQTPSSMHSFYEMSHCLCDAPFVMTTVDTVFREHEFARYISAFERILSDGVLDGLMGVTDYVDDERPLYVETDGKGLITGFYDAGNKQCRYVSAGIYGLTPPMIRTLHNCVDTGEMRMRNYQRALIRDGFRLNAYPFTHVIDIDHVRDIASAEYFLNQEE
ncbi:MAG: NTP transferase domain-containing protein [Prevotella sp.]|nr:NTP transferase domain-containing protein [Prevotella sp.]